MTPHDTIPRSKADRPTTLEGIEVTSEMIEAGLSPLYSFNHEKDEKEIVAIIYRAMERVRRGL